MQTIPRTDEVNAPEASKPVLASIKETFGGVPDIFATVAESPAAQVFFPRSRPC